MRQRSPLPRPLQRADPPSSPKRQTSLRPRSHRGMARLPSTLRSHPRRSSPHRRRRCRRHKTTRDPVFGTGMVLRHPPRIPLSIPGILSIPHHHLHFRGKGGGRSGQKPRVARCRRARRAGTTSRRVGRGNGAVLPPPPRGRRNALQGRHRHAPLPRVLRLRHPLPSRMSVGRLSREHCRVGCDLRSHRRIDCRGGGYENPRGIGEWGVPGEVEFDVSCRGELHDVTKV
mmetsp:Transcript_17958/g.37806  ORF Transcript_17958/g.37806 Transcript_17958/m.37806 type:complete len:229 (+) Transcript_17958:252-938(+)